MHHCPSALPREGQRLSSLPLNAPGRCVSSSLTAFVELCCQSSAYHSRLRIAFSCRIHLTLLGQIRLEYQNTHPRFVCKHFPNLDCIWDGQHAGPWAGPAKPAGIESLHLAHTLGKVQDDCTCSAQLSADCLTWSVVCRLPSIQPLLTLVPPHTVTVSFLTVCTCSL